MIDFKKSQNKYSKDSQKCDCDLWTDMAME